MYKRVYYYCYYSEAMFYVFEEWDSSVVRAPDLRLKGHGFESLQDQSLSKVQVAGYS